MLPIEDELHYIDRVAEISRAAWALRRWMADRLNSKAAALLTHVSIMIAVSSVLFSFSLNTPTLRDVPPIIGALLLLCEIVTYSLTSLLCLYAVQMTGPSSFRAEEQAAHSIGCLNRDGAARPIVLLWPSPLRRRSCSSASWAVCVLRGRPLAPCSLAPAIAGSPG